MDIVCYLVCFWNPRYTIMIIESINKVIFFSNGEFFRRLGVYSYYLWYFCPTDYTRNSIWRSSRYRYRWYMCILPALLINPIKCIQCPRTLKRVVLATCVWFFVASERAVKRWVFFCILFSGKGGWSMESVYVQSKRYNVNFVEIFIT